MITVLESLLDLNSKESLRIMVNFEDLYGIWKTFVGFIAYKALFLMHSFRFIRDLLISFVCFTKDLSWNYESAVFSDPAKSIIKSSPASIDL